MKKYVELFIASFGSAFTIAVRKYIVDNNILEQPYDVVAAVLLGAVLMITLRYILLELPYVFYITRKLLDPRAKFEGLYYEAFDKRDSCHISISRVKYDATNKQYQYYGNNYDTNDEVPKESWESLETNLNYADENLSYFYDSTWFDGKEHKTSGYGTLSFKTGTGHYYDLSPDVPRRVSHRVVRITGSLLKEFNGTVDVPDVGQWSKLATFIYNEQLKGAKL